MRLAGRQMLNTYSLAALARWRSLRPCTLIASHVSRRVPLNPPAQDATIHSLIA